MTKRYFHGGAPKLSEILPPNKTGAPTTADYGAEKMCDKNKVYCTTEFAEALVFAAFYPLSRGMVYEVEPIGLIEKDPDYVGQAECIQCDSAKVIRSYKLRWKDVLKIRKAHLHGN